MVEAYAKRGAQGQAAPRPITVPHEVPAVAMAHGYAKLARRLRKLLHERDLDVELSPEARTWLGDRGYDPQYGARPMRRAGIRDRWDAAVPEREIELAFRPVPM